MKLVQYNQRGLVLKLYLHMGPYFVSNLTFKIIKKLRYYCFKQLKKKSLDKNSVKKKKKSLVKISVKKKTAPTPVSSLVHSSTLVTAGIYLLIRFNKILFNNNIIILIIFIGLLTILLSRLNALITFDIKKIIAFSTLSQLGLIIFILSFNLTNYVFFHFHFQFVSNLVLKGNLVAKNTEGSVLLGRSLTKTSIPTPNLSARNLSSYLPSDRPNDCTYHRIPKEIGRRGNLSGAPDAMRILSRLRNALSSLILTHEITMPSYDSNNSFTLGPLSATSTSSLEKGWSAIFTTLDYLS